MILHNSFFTELVKQEMKLSVKTKNMLPNGDN